MRRKKKLKRLVCFFEGLTLNLRKRERRKKKREMVVSPNYRHVWSIV
jgi:hypothetical protein